MFGVSTTLTLNYVVLDPLSLQKSVSVRSKGTKQQHRIGFYTNKSFGTIHQTIPQPLFFVFIPCPQMTQHKKSHLP